MLVFVIPLKSRKVSASWENVCRLFERCVKSVFNQTSPNFEVIVVCNEKPLIEFNHPKLHYLETNFVLPENPDYMLKHLDKGYKILTGLLYASRFEPSHTMIVDADDCVSKKLAEFVTQNPQSNGWFVNRGYVYQEGSRLIYLRRSAFNRWCGTSNILRYDLNDLPDITEARYPEHEKYYKELGQHRYVVDNLEKNGTPLEPLPFTGAVYLIGNGENIYQTGFDTLHKLNQGILFKLKDSLNYRLLTQGIRNEFGLYNLPS